MTLPAALTDAVSVPREGVAAEEPVLLFEPIRSDCDEPFPVVLPVTGLVGITGEPDAAVWNTSRATDGWFRSAAV